MDCSVDCGLTAVTRIRIYVAHVRVLVSTANHYAMVVHNFPTYVHIYFQIKPFTHFPQVSRASVWSLP